MQHGIYLLTRKSVARLTKKHSCIAKLKFKANAKHKNYDQLDLFSLRSIVSYPSLLKGNLLVISF